LPIAASVISENERTTIEQGLSTAMINVMDSIEAQYTILGFKQNEKAAIKETFLTREGFMEALSDEKMKKFAVMLNNNLYAFRKRCTMTELLLTQHCFITITYLNFL
jgi:hypothetical protein